MGKVTAKLRTFIIAFSHLAIVSLSCQFFK
jgi:hypothetical protein